MSITKSNYERYDQAIKRLVVLIGLVDKNRDLAPFFENARQWMEGVPWTTEESSLAFQQLAQAQTFSLNQQPTSARGELLALVNVLAGRKNREPWSPSGAEHDGDPPTGRRSARKHQRPSTNELASEIQDLASLLSVAAKQIRSQWRSAKARATANSLRRTILGC